VLGCGSEGAEVAGAEVEGAGDPEPEPVLPRGTAFWADSATGRLIAPVSSTTQLNE
jgi:hypothetical protein